MQTTIHLMTVSDYKAMQGNIITFVTSADREAVLAALRSADTPNAVLRAQSRATQTFYSQLVTSQLSILITFPTNGLCFMQDGSRLC